jgi:hypothetical protein
MRFGAKLRSLAGWAAARLTKAASTSAHLARSPLSRSRPSMSAARNKRPIVLSRPAHIRAHPSWAGGYIVHCSLFRTW